MGEVVEFRRKRLTGFIPDREPEQTSTTPDQDTAPAEHWPQAECPYVAPEQDPA